MEVTEVPDLKNEATEITKKTEVRLARSGPHGTGRKRPVS